MNGFSNNLTTVQFKSAYKKLLQNCLNVAVPISANCTPRDDTFVSTNDVSSQISSTSVSISYVRQETSTDITNVPTPFVDITNSIRKKKSTPDREAANKKQKDERLKKKLNDFKVDSYLHLNYSRDVGLSQTEQFGWVATEYLKDVMKYTGGSIVRSIIKNLDCGECVSTLCGRTTEKSRLTIAKYRGGLHFASDEVVLICNKTEAVLRGHDDRLV
ncbi:hypothetical protein QAD02_013762 [Eretmocerus hayati]|uniref:Uncharacterized protein n=1 Tax=Eretmocerus hayati TaxID=131215 RepID=A0ACC2P3L6_9HYME|nr:hypothetical protein QAD02_013762 [Eretmocerus hayati]